MAETNDYILHFDAEWFLENHCSSAEPNEKRGNLRRFNVNCFHDFFNKGCALGNRLLDVGTGPSIHSILSACRHISDIDVTDFCPGNREILREWKRGNREIQRDFLTYEMTLVGDRRSVVERETELRSKIKGKYKIDVKEDSIFCEQRPKHYDVITSCLCLEAACTSLTEYKHAIRNISKYLKKGGAVALCGVLDETYYCVGNYIFPAATLSSEDIQSAWEENGFSIIDWKVMFSDAHGAIEKNKFSDYKNAFCMLAQRS